MKVQKLEQKRVNWLLLLIMVISAAGMIYFGTQKEGYHIDEMYSYGLANSEYLPFMHFGESGYDVKDWMLEYGAGESFADLFRNLGKDFRILKEHDFQFYNTPIYRDYLIAKANSAETRTTSWVPGQDYVDYLCVSESNTFNYASVYYNQRGDVHPPFYYMLLHTVCSVFQGTFSKWYALSINFVFLLLTLWLLHRMVSRYLGGEKVALAVAAVYGFSNGFFTSSMYLRMYGMLTFMVVALCYVHLKIRSEDFSLKRENIRKLILATFFGYLTHYYFVLYAIGVAAVFVIWMCIRKKWRSLLQYVLAMGSTAVIGVCLWPFAIKHVFGGYRGQESLDVIASGDFHWIKIKLMLDQIFGQLFGGRWWIPVVCLVIMLVAAFAYRKAEGKLGKGILVFLPMGVYVIVTAQIVPFYVERYVMCTYPFWCVLAVLAVREGTKFLNENDALCLAAVAFLIVMNNGFTHKPGYLYTGGQEWITVPENSHCVYVLPDGSWNESAEDTLMLSKCEQVAVVYRSQLPLLKDTYNHQEGNCVIVTLSRNLEETVVLPEVKQILGIADMEESFREEAYNTIRIYFQ